MSNNPWSNWGMKAKGTWVCAQTGLAGLSWGLRCHATSESKTSVMKLSSSAINSPKCSKYRFEKIKCTLSSIMFVYVVYLTILYNAAGQQTSTCLQIQQCQSSWLGQGQASLPSVPSGRNASTKSTPGNCTTTTQQTKMHQKIPQ